MEWCRHSVPALLKEATVFKRRRLVVLLVIGSLLAFAAIGAGWTWDFSGVFF
jgi:hypothetical protein